MSWHTGPMAGFDLETTGVDPVSDRIVTACVVRCGGGRDTESRSWLADPGVDIPDGAAGVHGITTDIARAEGRPAAEVVSEVTEALAGAAAERLPIVIMNASFDLTMLDHECARHGVRSLWDRTDAIPMIVDPKVLDKRVDRYRRGGRTLTALCAHYRVRLNGAHAADADAIAACRVAWRIASTCPEVGDTALEDLHEQQARWAREQAEGLRQHFEETPGKEHQAATVRGDWPLIPAQRAGGEA